MFIFSEYNEFLVQLIESYSGRNKTLKKQILHKISESFGIRELLSLPDLQIGIRSKRCGVAIQRNLKLFNMFVMYTIPLTQFNNESAIIF